MYCRSASAGTTVAAAVAAAKAADVAIVFGSAHSGEGKDRTDLLFSHGRHAAAVTVAAGASDNNCSVYGNFGMISVL